MPELVTVFTPTYNRAHILHRCYESLCSQSSYNFKWLVVDDGSTDNTREIVKQWCENENNFKIEYIYKENGGLHTAYNTAVQLVDSELFCCLESDDYFTSDAIVIIEKEWEIIKNTSCVGFVSLCKTPNGDLIGQKYPKGIKTTPYYKHRIYAEGDKQYVFKTDMLKKVFPQKVFKGEKYFDPKYSFFLLDEYGPLLVTNEIFDIADYQPGGLTDTIISQYYNSPNSFCEYRKLYMTRPGVKCTYIYRQNIHYVSSCCLAHKLKFAIIDSPKPFYTFAALLPGVLLAQCIKHKNKKRNIC